MSGTLREPDAQPQSARALSPSRTFVVRSCPVCGAELTGRQRACSGRCRAALSRRSRAEKLTEREARLQGLVKLLGKEVGLSPDDLA